MKVTSVITGYFKLDGGAMFGVVPKSIWSKKYPADENNMCKWAMRSLYVEWGDRKMVVDTGIGTKQSSKWQSFFSPTGGDILSNLNDNFINAEEITDVFITHLHFDHVGGALYVDEKGNFQLSFPNARYWICDKHYDWAINPNPREKPSFLQENFLPLKQNDVISWLPYEKSGFTFDNDIDILFFDGHTEAMMGLVIKSNGKKIFYPSDLLPSHCHIGASYVMAYDVRPLVTMEERDKFLHQVFSEDGIIVFEHDYFVESTNLELNDSGAVVIKEKCIANCF